eukprot:365942-Chlamydomonas_euryale.AAC.81
MAVPPLRRCRHRGRRCDRGTAAAAAHRGDEGARGEVGVHGIALGPNLSDLPAAPSPASTCGDC